MAQYLAKMQFPLIGGLQCTLLQQKDVKGQCMHCHYSTNCVPTSYYYPYQPLQYLGYATPNVGYCSTMLQPTLQTKHLIHKIKACNLDSRVGASLKIIIKRNYKFATAQLKAATGKNLADFFSLCVPGKAKNTEPTHVCMKTTKSIKLPHSCWPAACIQLRKITQAAHIHSLFWKPSLDLSLCIHSVEHFFYVHKLYHA